MITTLPVWLDSCSVVMVVLIQRVAVVGGAGTVWIIVVTISVSLLVSNEEDVCEMTVPERVDDPAVDSGKVLVMVFSIPVALDPEAEAEAPTVSVETITVTICVVVVVDTAEAVEDGDTRVLLVQMGPLPDACVVKVPTPEDTEVVDHGRADPVVKTSDVPF